MARGRSKYTLQIPSKAAKKGYKIYSLCDHGYLLDFLSKIAKISGLEDLKPTTELYRKDAFNDSERAVLSLVKRIQTVYPDRDAFAVVLDNFFTSHRLYIELRACMLDRPSTRPSSISPLRSACVRLANPCSSPVSSTRVSTRTLGGARDRHSRPRLSIHVGRPGQTTSQRCLHRAR